MTARADVSGPAAGPAEQRAGGDTTTEVDPLARAVLGPEEEAAVIEVLRSGQLSLGPRVPAFEQAFAAWVGAEHARRGGERDRRAGRRSLRAVGVADGDEVVTSPFSFVASANSALLERARPVFADIDLVTLNLDPDAAAAAVTDRTARVLPGATSSATRPTCPPSSASGPADRRGRLRGAGRRATRRGAGRRARRIRPPSASTRTSS